MPTSPTTTLPVRGSKGTLEGWRGAGGNLWWSKPQTPQSSPGGSQWGPIPRTMLRALSIATGQEDPGHSARGAGSTATPRHCQPARQDPLGNLSAAQIQPRPTAAKKPACPSSWLRKHPQHCCWESNRLMNPLLLPVLPALVRQQGNFQGDALRNTPPPPPTSNGEGPTVPSQSPQKLHARLPQRQPKLPKILLPLQQVGPTPLSDRDFKATAPLPPDRNDHQGTATILRAISRTSANTGQRHEEEALGQPCTKGSRRHLSRRGSEFCKGPPREDLVPPRAQGDAGSGPSTGRVGTQLSFKALRVPHLRCEPLKSFFLLFVVCCVVFFFLLDKKVTN